VVPVRLYVFWAEPDLRCDLLYWQEFSFLGYLDVAFDGLLPWCRSFGIVWGAKIKLEMTKAQCSR
tara:strand:- start:250 stop:444 length:195 start_codon:yes stop_codon:yes gene_type:complete